MKMVEVGSGGFESRVSIPHDFPCERGLRSACSGQQRDSRYPSVINNETQCVIVNKFLETTQAWATVQNALPQAPRGHKGGNQVLGQVNRHIVLSSCLYNNPQEKLEFHVAQLLFQLCWERLNGLSKTASLSLLVQLFLILQLNHNRPGYRINFWK